MSVQQGTRAKYEPYPQPHPDARRYRTFWGNWPAPDDDRRADVELVDQEFGPPGSRQKFWPRTVYHVRPVGRDDVDPQVIEFRRTPDQSPKFGFYYAGVPHWAFGEAVAAALTAIQRRGRTYGPDTV